MEKKYYSLEKKITFLKKFKEIGSVAEAAKAVGASYHNGYYWLKHKTEIEKAHEKILLLCYSTKTTFRIRRTISLEEKIRVIKLIDSGLCYREVEKQTEYQYSLIYNWDHTRDHLLALYYFQNNQSEKKSNRLESSHVVAWEDDVPKDEKEKELNKKIKAQAKEIDYLMDKVTFLESLNTILKEKNGPVKKKKFSKQSNKASKKEEQT